MKYEEINKDNLESWKMLLSAEDVIKLDSDLDDYVWYSIIDEEQIVAIFQIIDVKVDYSKNIDIKFSPIIRREDERIIDIIVFIYESMLKICNKNKINKIKIHTHDPLMKFIFQELSTTHHNNNTIKNVKKYGKWIEIDL